MRTCCLCGFLCVFALGLGPISGCGDDPAAGGTGGAGGRGGVSGTGGAAGQGGTGGVPQADNPLNGIGAVELVADGFVFTEGPTWRSAEGKLLFSDIPGNTIYELTPPDSVEVFRADSGNSNGLDSDLEGLLLAAEHGNRRLSRTLPDGTIVEVTGQYRGDRLNSPNDIAVRSDGTIYFTDPPYGLDSPATEQELDFNGVFRVDPAGDLTAEWEGPLSSRPNGIVLSPDERTLYVADTEGDVMAFDVLVDGRLTAERAFVDAVQFPDGMAIDADGNLFVTDLRGVRVYNPDGELWGTIEIPDDRLPRNCAFGGDDARTLYIAAEEALYRVSLARPGLF